MREIKMTRHLFGFTNSTFVAKKREWRGHKKWHNHLNVDSQSFNQQALCERNMNVLSNRDNWTKKSQFN